MAYKLRRRVKDTKDPRPRDEYGHFLPHKEEAETKDIIKQLQDEGYTVVKEELKTERRFRIDLKRFSGKSYKFAAASDPHLGSRYQQLTHLHAFYKLAKKEGIDTILSPGDICEGNGNIYKGQEYEIFKHGADAQREYVIENYPKEEGITTYFIGGNHEDSFWKDDGYDIGRAIAKEREDMKYLGLYGAYVKVGGLRIYLHHPDGGVAYARSYRMQKLIEQFAPEQKPNIVLQGHFHIVNVLPMYRNVEGVNIGSFQAQTPYLKRKGLYPSVSGLFVEVIPDPKGLARIKYELIPFYEVIENDF